MEQATKTKLKKILSVAGTVLTVLVIAFTAYIVVSVIIARSKNTDVNLFGYSFGVVLTDSMEPEISPGDLIIFTHGSIEDVEVGDNIVFVAGNGFDPQIRGNNVVHSVKEINVLPDGTISIVTRGINNSSDDIYPVTAENFVGKCVYHSEAWGNFFTFMINYGFIILIVVVALPFIVSQVIKIIKLAKNKDEEE